MSRRLAIAGTFAAAVAAGALFAPAASASNVAWSVSLGVPGVAVTAGAPGYYAPYARPYYRPYYRAAPVVYAPPVAYVDPYPYAYAAPYGYAAPAAAVVVGGGPVYYGHGHSHGHYHHH